MAIWNLNVKVMVSLGISWLVMAGLSITLPVKGGGMVRNEYCTFSIDGTWVGAFMSEFFGIKYARVILYCLQSRWLSPVYSVCF